ncbi:hypothetical protein ACHAXT_006321 [Thalassiosira profunda]
MNTAASTAARAARRCTLRRPLHLPLRSFASAEARAPSPDAVVAPPRTYSENEFPDRNEPPVITQSHANPVAGAAKSMPPPKYTISPSRCIGPERPAHIPPNVPLDSLEVPDTKITTLPNGVRVGSMENFSQVSTVGVLLDFGSRHELDDYTVPGTNTTISTAGVNHLMELLAFQSTKNHSGTEIRNIMEHLGGAHFATSSREQMMYCVDVLRPNVNAAFDILGETIKCPLIEGMEVEEMKQVIQFQNMDMMHQMLMGEGLQMAGYGPIDGKVQQLGRPHFCTDEALPKLTAQSVHAFREQHLLHQPQGIVVSGSGIEHDALVELAQAHFGHIPAQEAAANDGRTIPSIYTGGEYRLQRPPNPNPAKPEYTHVAIAFEVGGWHSSDLVPACVLQTLLGGGSSFSAGGPGKGMYSRLYREVLNRYHWAESAEAFSSFHSESGLWGISGSCPPGKSRELTRALADHFLKLENEPVTDEELGRARNMLKCNVLTQLESRLVLFEDIGRQILTYGQREDARTMCAKIDAVTKEDIQKVVQKAMEKPPTLATVGIDIKNVPRVDEVKQWMGQAMADEIAPPQAGSEPVVVDAPENDADAAAPAKKAKGKKPREQKEQVPIEELYDLSQPIKKIERPSKEKHEEELAAIDAAIEDLRAQRKTLQSKIDSAFGKDKNKNSPLGKERDVLNKLKNRKGLMIEQKRQIRTRLEIIKADADRLIGQQKNARSGMKFTNLADINQEINRLQRKQETVSMSLADEKKLIKEIEALQASRRTAEEISTKQGSLDDIKQDRKVIQADLTAKDKEIDAIQKEIDAQSKVVKDLYDKQSSERGQVDDLFKQRDALKADMDAQYKLKSEVHLAFREKTNDWYQCQRAIKAQRQLQYEEEKKKREEEKKAWLKKKEEEELAKTPYEEEMALCDYLADYLTKTYLTDAAEEAEKKAKAAEEKAKADVVAVKDDPFAGFAAMSKKKDDDEDNYFSKGKKGKGGGKKGNKSKKASKSATFSVSLDLFEQFGMISLSPPTSLEGVSASVEELKAKKKWYSEQPRGSVPTARDIRKANEAKSKGGSNGKAKGGGGKASGKKGNNFDISNDSEFAPLGAGAASSGASGWGKVE